MYQYCVLLPDKKTASSADQQKLYWETDMDDRISYAMAELRARKFAKPNDPVVVLHGWATGSNNTNILRVVYMPKSDSEKIVLPKLPQLDLYLGQSSLV